MYDHTRLKVNVCIYVCVCWSKPVILEPSTRTYIHTCLCVHMYEYTRTHTHTQKEKNTNPRRSVCLRAVAVNIHTSTRLVVYVYIIHTCIYIFTYTGIRKHTHAQKKNNKYHDTHAKKQETYHWSDQSWSHRHDYLRAYEGPHLHHLNRPSTDDDFAHFGRFHPCGRISFFSWG
jgi:hypothetical protein